MSTVVFPLRIRADRAALSFETRLFFPSGIKTKNYARSGPPSRRPTQAGYACIGSSISRRKWRTIAKRSRKSSSPQA